ncbi:MAG: hypothetical protein ACOX3S_11275 [Anaerolineae bacterium]|jgi:hypothetical protein
MVDDLTAKAQGSQGKLESLLNKIPGYGDYRQKELRRDADKLLRMQVAGRYREQLQRIGDLQFTLTEQGDLKGMMVLERAALKLQLLIDRLRTASYGYSGFFDAVKVSDDTLDALYDFDLAMLDGVDRVGQELDRLAGLVSEGTMVGQEANAIVRMVDELNTTFGHRQDVLLS